MGKWTISILALVVLSGCADDSTQKSGEQEQATGSRGTSRVSEVTEDSPLNVVEWDAAARLLTDAASMVEERGFQQGATEDVYSVCVTTALERSFFQGDYSIVDFNYALEALSQLLGVPREVKPDPDLPLDVPFWGRHLIEWNDEEGRTEEEVISAFEDAATLALELRDEAQEKGVQL